MVVLAVDNDAEALERLKESLKSVFPNAEIKAFSDAMLAVQYICSRPAEISCMVCALLMRHIDGLRITDWVKRYLPETPVYVTTQEELTRECKALVWENGIAGCIVKPVTAQALRRQLAQ